MDNFTILYYIGIFGSLSTYAWTLFSGVEDAISGKYNLQLTIMLSISILASFVKLPKCFFSDEGTLREQLLFFGLFTLQALGLMFNIYAFRHKYHHDSNILISILVLFYIISFIVFFPRFLFFKNKLK